MLFHRKKRVQPIAELAEPPEVTAAKKHIQRVSKDTAKNAKQLRATLEANGITFQIKLATGGKH